MTSKKKVRDKDAYSLISSGKRKEEDNFFSLCFWRQVLFRWGSFELKSFSLPTDRDIKTLRYQKKESNDAG